MGLKCSLLGHDFGDPEVETEREEEGSEVVTTVREVATCSRCGTENVVSENKEITAIEEDGASAVDRADASTDDPAASTANEGGEIDSPAAEGGPDGIDHDDPAVDDGVILDETESTERTPGRWPEHDDVRADEPDDVTPAEEFEWPDAEGEDEGFDAEPSDGGDAGVEFGGGLTPERPAPEDDDAEFIETTDYNQQSDVTAASPVDPPSSNNAESDDGLDITRAAESTSPGEGFPDDVDTEYYCPECGLSMASDHSSLRAGDICPECRRGYIAERER